MYSIDLNSDMGESFGAYRIGNDEGIIQHITSTNVACGYHAGDPMVMDKVVRMAKERGVAVGAHPGYPDLMGFGRRKMTLSVDEIKNYMKYQIGALMAFTQSYGLKLQHVAPHGALGNLCQYDRETSRAICEAVYEIDPSIRIFYCAGAVLGEEAQKMGLKTAAEIFADRAYQADGSLVPRKLPGAVIHDKDEAIARTVRMVTEGKVTAITGEEVEIAAHSICVHGDNPSAVEFVKNIRAQLTARGVEIAPIREIV